ncbi:MULTISPECIES: signal peptidase I [unclassified Bacteroides]|uniref:signal peptidase I n=1 Tax=unclassified Bacteroides TaxID=2646097 RepID=UPI000B37C976|nr:MULTISPECIES: signal peptidase I [unclassified Bacteroides]OUN80028.1 signal peptidase I [Bacteroides sp. An51A]OUP27252.1 signal peptidase I [Bacteroides sp. An19]
MKRIRIIRKKVFCLAYKVCAVAVCLYAAWIVLRIAGQVFLFASFSIPSDSMVPVLRPGDYVLVDKPLKGARIFDVWDAAEHRPFEIRRLPGLEEFRRGEVLVFNFPYPERWDSIGFDVMLYYVKRCIGEPGDTVEIRDARYLVRGTDVPVGNTDAQERLSRLLSKKSGRKEMIRQHCYYTFPHDSTLGWNVCNFGPLYVPARGDSIEMTRNHYLFYRNLIEWEQRRKLVQKDDGFYLEGKRITGYRFRENYYFMGGDNCFNSQDSRYWGLLPEPYLVGKATRIWKSVDPYTGSVDWRRVWKRIE